MVKFSCFNAHIDCHKPKKSVEVFQPSVEAKRKTLEDCSHIPAPNDSPDPRSLNSFRLKPQGDTQINNGAKNVATSSSAERGWKSEEMKGKFSIESDIEEHRTRGMKKSQSLGSELYREGRVSVDNDTEDGTDQGFSCNGSHEHDGLVLPYVSRGADVAPLYQYQNVSPSESFLVSSDLVNNESSIFSSGETEHSEKEGRKNYDTTLSGVYADDYSDHMPRTPPVIVKSSSSPNIGASTPTSGSRSPFHHVAPRSRSCDDLHVLDVRKKDNSIHEVETQEMQEKEMDDSIFKAGKNKFKNPVHDGYDSYTYVGLAKEWVKPVLDEAPSLRNLQGESSVHWLDEFPIKDFKIKLMEEWIADLQHCNLLEEVGEPNDSNDQVKKDSNILNGLTATKVDVKVTHGMESAKRYISSLSAATTTAQLANHGLVKIPFLSAFVSLRVLNLSGNSIVRITAGDLPRGLHTLNLSKNNISTIEGLRELTRLRAVDLSYNRIIRIGHGLASCSSLKELYLAGNKISEVEGLHRLLKLTVLDLRFNKISTAKCLGQLASNYSSLQAISLEGNPAQKNVGDDQVKKYLQGLLPHLVCFNQKPIKVSSLKDAADRSLRLGVSAHQFDRGLRSEHKATRKGGHGVAVHRSSSSSTNGRRNQAVVSPKQSRGRHTLLPPSGTKPTGSHQHHRFDFGSKFLNFRPDLAIRKSQSEGILGAL